MERTTKTRKNHKDVFVSFLSSRSGRGHGRREFLLHRRRPDRVRGPEETRGRLSGAVFHRDPADGRGRDAAVFSGLRPGELSKWRTCGSRLHRRVSFLISHMFIVVFLVLGVRVWVRVTGPPTLFCSSFRPSSG